jgi:hypothetical protein
MKSKMIDFLLNNSGPSIRLRVKEEILQDISEEEKIKLQQQILLELKIQLIINNPRSKLRGI